MRSSVSRQQASGLTGAKGADHRGFFGSVVGALHDLDSDGLVEPFSSLASHGWGVYDCGSGMPRYFQLYTGGHIGSEARSVDRISDISGDGIPDLVVGANDAFEMFPDPGWVRAYSGRTGKKLWEYSRGADSDSYDVCALGDVSGDGFSDVAIAHMRAQTIEVVSGRNLRSIWSVKL